MAAPVLSHLQTGSSRRVHAREEAVSISQGAMPPPPLPGYWAPDSRAQLPAARVETPSQVPSRRPSFLPPPTPQASSSSSRRFIPQTPSRAAGIAQAASPHTFGPGPHFGSQSQTQRFVPSGAQHPSAAAPGSVSGTPAIPSARAEAIRSPSLSTSRAGGQRTPFVPTGGGLS